MTASKAQPSGARDMVLIAGGATRMGSAAFYADEGPVHDREIAPFWIDRYEVTYADYARFVDETGYVTVAERALDPSKFAGANPADLGYSRQHPGR